VRDAVVAAALEHVERADDVALDISVGFFQRMAHPRLSAQMHDAVEFLGAEQGLHRVPIGQIHMYEAERAVRLQARQPVAFERNRVIIVQIIEAADLVAALKQARRGGSSDEPSGARYKKFH
jgi:tRNA threonylcarbamoyladenosine modification (KEOPS) complex Cgi121 subunit